MGGGGGHPVITPKATLLTGNLLFSQLESPRNYCELCVETPPGSSQSVSAAISDTVAQTWWTW